MIHEMSRGESCSVVKILLLTIIRSNVNNALSSLVYRVSYLSTLEAKLLRLSAVQVQVHFYSSTEHYVLM